jgi:holo-[acyl-carrier protein] synthase
MIKRVGLDVIEVDRIGEAMRNPRFLERILTPAEREQIRAPMRIAGRWAAKEAIAKAVGLHLSWHDVEILIAEDGSPEVTIRHDTWDPSRYRIHISITHEKGIAAAVAVLESVDER